MTKFEIAAALQEIASLLRLSPKDLYRARAYAKAAKAVADQGDDFSSIVEEKRLTEIPGIGGSLAAAIEELYFTGKSSALEKVREEMPEGVLALSRLSGLSLEKIQRLSTLGITNLEELKAAITAGEIRKLPGFGAKSEAALLDQISRRESRDSQLLLLHALRIAEKVIEHMRTSPQLQHIEVAGAARRWKETVSVIRLVTSTQEKPEQLVDHFLRFPFISEVETKERMTASVRLMEGARVSLAVACDNDYWNLLHHETGSNAHLKKLARVADENGIKFTPTKLTPAGKRKSLMVQSEADIYSHLKMQYVPPELREDEGEIEEAIVHSIPTDLITIEDIQGMVHCHSTYSDGRNSIEEMARAAEAMGMKYMTITDHSPTAQYAGGVTVDRLKEQWDEIDEVQEKVSIKLLRGTESDILRDGALDYPDRILEKFDVIIASIHQRYKLDEDEMTRRVINAMKNPFFKIWGHPLGRLVLQRPPISVRIEEILDVIAESGAAIEISGSPHRLDLEPRWTREARRRNIKFVISTDAHSTAELENLRFGVGIARRAGVRRREVLNTLEPALFQQSVRPA